VTAESPEGVNPHYLNHVVEASASNEVVAGEDIVTSQGIKLLAKGARIDAGARDRLLQHKLLKPLEDCVQVLGGDVAARIEPAGVALLDKHALLRGLCAPDRARSAPASLAALSLSLPVQSLLTVHARCLDERLGHTMGVAMIALALARRLRPGDIDNHRVLATAGLLHDVGELYIDPAYLRKDTRLAAEEWRHIASHPVVAHRVLHGMAGAGPAVADAVLLHHERLDGFGYPRGVSAEAFALNGQILAAAEWLMAVVEADASPLTRARMAAQLIPGEFDPALLDALSDMAREAPDSPIELASALPLEMAAPRVMKLAETLSRFAETRSWIDERIATAQPGLRAVLLSGLQRALRIQASFSSTGLDVHSPERLIGELAGLNDPAVYREITTLVGELEWRMRQLEREQRLRASLLTPPEQGVITELINRLKGRHTDRVEEAA